MAKKVFIRKSEGDKMKKLILTLLIVLFFPTLSFSQTTIHQPRVKMWWSQVIAPTLSGWNFYASKTQGTGYVLMLNKAYVATEGSQGTPDPNYPEYPAQNFMQTMDIPMSVLTSWTFQRIYFVARAIRIDGSESEPSSEMYVDLDLRNLPPPKVQGERLDK